MFSETERQIFEYANWDGSKKFADPARTLRRFQEATRGGFNDLLRRSKDVANLADASQALEAIADAVVYAFEITDGFDAATGKGWMESQILGLGDLFNKYLNGLKKSTPASVTSSPPTGG